MDRIPRTGHERGVRATSRAKAHSHQLSTLVRPNHSRSPPETPIPGPRRSPVRRPCSNAQAPGKTGVTQHRPAYLVPPCQSGGHTAPAQQRPEQVAQGLPPRTGLFKVQTNKALGQAIGQTGISKMPMQVRQVLQPGVRWVIRFTHKFLTFRRMFIQHPSHVTPPDRARRGSSSSPRCNRTTVPAQVRKTRSR